MAVYCAISLVYYMTQKDQKAPSTNQEPVTNLSDGMSALQAIGNTRNMSGQWIIQAILQLARTPGVEGVLDSPSAVSPGIL